MPAAQQCRSPPAEMLLGQLAQTARIMWPQAADTGGVDPPKLLLLPCLSRRRCCLSCRHWMVSDRLGDVGLREKLILSSWLASGCLQKLQHGTAATCGGAATPTPPASLAACPPTMHLPPPFAALPLPLPPLTLAWFALPPLQADGYERACAFTDFGNWLIPGRVMLGRYPFVEPSRCRSRDMGEEQLRQLLAAGITTFVCLQVSRSCQQASGLPQAAGIYLLLLLFAGKQGGRGKGGFSALALGPPPSARLGLDALVEFVSTR